MARNDMHLDAMLRHLGAAYYESIQGRATRSDVTRALDTVAEHLNEQPAHPAASRAPAAGHPEHPGHRHQHSRLWARRVQDLMTTSVVSVDQITPYKEITRLLAEHKIGAVPVLAMGRHVTGVVSEADLVAVQDEVAQRARIGGTGRRWRPRGQHPVLTAGVLMTSPAITIHPDAPIPSAARLMHTHHVRMLPVVDTQGQIVGVVSRRDLLSIFLRPDTEIADDVRQVLAEVFGTEGVEISAQVRSGIVTITGTPEPGAGRHDGLTPVASRLIWGVDGVVDVVNKLNEPAA